MGGCFGEPGHLKHLQKKFWAPETGIWRRRRQTLEPDLCSQTRDPELCSQTLGHDLCSQTLERVPRREQM